MGKISVNDETLTKNRKTDEMNREIFLHKFLSKA